MSKRQTHNAFAKQSAFAVALNVVWKSDPYQRLAKLKNAVRKKYLAKATREASKIVLKQMRVFVPIGKLGALKRSLAYRAYVPKKSADKSVGIGVIGAKRRFYVSKGRKFIQSKKGQAPTDVLARPSKYFHLVNKGTVRADARPFADQALRVTFSEAKQKMFDVLQHEVRNVWP